MTLLNDFVRVNRCRPCPVCGRAKFCLVDQASPTDPARVICTKIESPKRWGEAGWLHELRDDGVRRGRTAIRTVAFSVSNPKFEALAARFQAAMTTERLQRLAKGLGLAPESLTRLGAGVVTGAELEVLGTTCRAAGCWTFPMCGSNGAVVGIRLRTPDGFKYAIAGSKQGLFLPADLAPGGTLLIAEGPTDTAALLDLGFAAVGRPSCTGGTRLLVALVGRLRPASAVVVADADEPGLRGASALAGVLAAYVPDVRVIRPPEGFKDARAWKNGSPDAAVVGAQVRAAIGAAIPLRLTVHQAKAVCK